MCLGVHFRPPLFHQRCTGLVKLQFTFHQIIRTDEPTRLYLLMYSEIVRYQTVLVNGEPVSSIQIAGKGGNVVVLSGSKPGLLSGGIGYDGAGMRHVTDYGSSLGILTGDCRTSQRKTVHTLHFYFRHARHRKIEPDATTLFGTPFIPVFLVGLMNRYCYF